MADNDSPSKLQIGVSECLLGAKVRFDGGHKRDAYITNILGQYAEFIPFCPEVAIGMGVPRPPIHLEGEVLNPKVVGIKDKSIDVTKDLHAYSRKTAKTLRHLHGFVLKSKSPTCGMERVRIYHPAGHGSVTSGVGVFARALMEAQPLLPLEEEGRLNDPILRENFITRVFAYQRWQLLIAAGINMQKLVEFHTRHKLLLMAHNIAGYKRLGYLVANHEKLTINKLSKLYIADFMEILQRKANKKNHANALMHLMGYLKQDISTDDKQELLDVIHAYRLDKLPLIVPITLLKHHFRHHPHSYVADQIYLSPHPDELMLMNHI